MNSARNDEDLQGSAGEHETATEHAGHAAPADSTVEADATRPAEWTGAMAGLKSALAQVDSACNSIVAQMLEVRADSDAVADRASKRVADVEFAAEAAIQRARLQSDLELAELRTQVERLQADLQTQRERFERGSSTGDPQGRSGSADLADDPSGRGDSYRSQLSALREELEASRAESIDLVRQIEVEKAKHARLIAAVRSVQRTKLWGTTVVSLLSAAEFEPSEDRRDQLPAVVEPAVTPREIVAADLRAGAPIETETPQAEQPGSASDFNPSEYAVRLFNEIKSVYEDDTLSGLPFPELVERLTANLRYAASVFARRAGVACGDTRQVFDRQLAVLLDELGGTMFGRHLAVAAYDFQRTDDGERAEVA